jgi:hypothetical protein
MGSSLVAEIRPTPRFRLAREVLIQSFRPTRSRGSTSRGIVPPQAEPQIPSAVRGGFTHEEQSERTIPHQADPFRRTVIYGVRAASGLAVDERNHPFRHRRAVENDGGRGLGENDPTEVSMIGTAFAGSPGAQFGQPIGGLSPYGAYPMANPIAQQTTPYLQSQPFGMQAQPFAQPMQLLQILPQQLGQVSQLLQQQISGLQQLLQVVPHQLQQIHQLLQVLPQQIHQLQLQTQQQQQQQQPFGAQAAPGFGYGAWQQPGASIGPTAFTGQPGAVM